MLKVLQKKLSSPRADLYEEIDQYVLKLELCGYRKNDITMEVSHNNFLYIQGSKNNEHPDQQIFKKYIFNEIQNCFFRKIKLPKNVNVNCIDATLDDGLLVIKLKKAII